MSLGAFLLPSWVKPALLAILVAAAYATGIGTGTRWVSGRLEAAKAAHEKDRAAWALQRLQGELAERAKEARREDALRETAHVASLARAHADADHRAADVAHQRLLDAARSYTARLPAGPGAAPAEGGEAAAGPGLVLVDVLGWADDTAGELAAALDRARIAGLACERAYDSLDEPRIEAGQVTP